MEVGEGEVPPLLQVMQMTVSSHERPIEAEADEIEQWLEALDPTTTPAYDATPHRHIVEASKVLVEAESELRKAVADARAAGYSWATVGASLGVSRQAAQQRFDEALKPVPHAVSESTQSDQAVNVRARRKRGTTRTTASNGNDRHVVKNPEGGWDVVGADAERRSAHTDTQRQAIDRAREIVHNAGGGEVLIHDRQGRIRDKETVVHGTDPNPPRDKR